MKNVAVLTEDGAFALFFRLHHEGFDSSRVPTPGNLPSIPKQKCLCPGVSPGGGGLGAAGIDWCINFTRFLHILFMRFKTKDYDVIDLNLLHFKLIRFHFKNPDKSVPPPLLTEFEFEVANLDWK